MTSQQPTLSQANALPELKGAPLAVLLALWRDGRSGRKELITRTGWKKDAVSAALKELIRLQLVVRHSHREWGVAAGVLVPQLLGLGGASAEEGAEKRETRPTPVVEERETRPVAPAVATREQREKRPARAGERKNGRSPKGIVGKVVDKANSRGRKMRAAGEQRSGRRWTGHGAERSERLSRNRPERPKRSSGGEEYGRQYHSSRSGNEVSAEPVEQRMAEENALRHNAHFHARDDYALTDDPYPSDLNQNKKNDHEEVQRAIIQSLQSLTPPFDNAAAWLRTVSPSLVAGWLAHLRMMPQSQRSGIRNEAAFIRSRVSKGLKPPHHQRTEHEPPRRSDRARMEYVPEPIDEPPPRWVVRGSECPDCGRTYYDQHGECLVCDGVIKV